MLISLYAIACVPASAQKTAGIIENAGQWPDHVVGRTTVASSHFWLEKNRFTYHMTDLSPIVAMHGTDEAPVAGATRLRGHVFRTHFTGASENAEVHFEEPEPLRHNFYLGNAPEKWRSSVQEWRKVSYSELYPGVDMDVYFSDHALKYDLLVEAGADASVIQLHYEGADSLKLRNGRLVVYTSVGEVTEQAPIAWQNINGSRERVECQYFLNGNSVQFFFPDGYDPAYALTIDPVLLFSTYSGSTANNFGFTATYDDEGFLYAGSISFGDGYPTSVGAYQQEWAGGDGQGGLVGTDITLTKYTLDGTDRVYSTYLGGSNDELPHSLIVNSAGELIVMGTTSSPDFPVTTGAFSASFSGGSNVAPSGVGVEYVNGADLIVTKFTADGGALAASTFLGGSANDGVNSVGDLRFNYADEFRGEVEIDDEDNIYIASCTFSNDYPTENALQPAIAGGLDGVITKLTPDLDGLIYSTYFGAPGDQGVYSLAVRSDDDIYICGGTNAGGMPLGNDGFQQAFGGGDADGFLARLTANGSTILEGTYFGSNDYDQFYFVDVDDADVAHAYGQTLAGSNEFILNADYASPNSGMLITKFTGGLSGVAWSTRFGTGDGTCNLSPTAFLVDVCGKIYLSGWGGNTNASFDTGFTTGMDTTPDAYQSSTDGSDFYLLVIEDDASDIVFGSFFGGNQSSEHVDGGTSRFNRKGQIYQSVCAGCGGNDDFPIFPADAVGPVNNSSCNNGVFKFDFQLPITVADFFAEPEACINSPIQFQNNSTTSQDFFWDFGDGTTTSLTNPVHTYDAPGTYEIMLVANNPETCNFTDTLFRTIDVQIPVTQTAALAELCAGDSIEIGPEQIVPGFTYEWLPPLSAPDNQNPIVSVSPEENTTYTLLIEGGACVDTLIQTIEVTNLSLTASDDIVLCGPGETVTLQASSENDAAEFTWSDDPDFTNVIASGDDATSVQVLIEEEGNYYVQAAANGCTLIEVISVSFSLGALDLGEDLVVCAGDTVTVTLQNNLPNFDLVWSPTDLIINGQGTPSIQAIVTEDVEISLIASDGEDCVIEGSIFVSASGIDPASVTASADPDIITAGDFTTLTATPEGYDYTWFPDDSVEDPNLAETEANPQQTTTFYLTVADGECLYTDSVQVRVFDFVCGPPSIYVPNAFTPDGNDNNDKLYVRGNNITDLNFVIYNRWGEKVFETNSLVVGWDGTYKGRPADPAVFVYYLEAFCEGGDTYFEKGNITLIR